MTLTILMLRTCVCMWYQHSGARRFQGFTCRAGTAPSQHQAPCSPTKKPDQAQSCAGGHARTHDQQHGVCLATIHHPKNLSSPLHTNQASQNHALKKLHAPVLSCTERAWPSPASHSTRPSQSTTKP